MLDIERSTTLAAGINEVFEFLKDPYNIPQWNPACREVSARGGGWHLICDSRGYKYELDVAWEPDAAAYSIRSRNLHANAVSVFELERQGERATKVTYGGRYDMGKGVAGWMSEKFFWSRVLQERAENIVAALEQIFSVQDLHG
jgi:carbon monoxide dehydrogenase subunit G